MGGTLTGVALFLLLTLIWPRYTDGIMHGLFRLIGRILGTLRAEYRQLANRYFGHIERFEGDARAICQQILDRLWYKDFYRTSLGHFDFFWMRDFGTVAKSLVDLGHTDKVHHTLRWALRHYRKSGTVTTCIDSVGNTFNAPDLKAIDSLPWLLHCLWVSRYPLRRVEHKFLQRQLEKYQQTFLDPDSGMIKPHIRYVEMRDAVIYDRSAYAYSLLARMARCADKLGLDFPYHVGLYRQKLVNHYWTGEYFRADNRTDAFSAECALFPFLLGIVDDEMMFGATYNYIVRHQLNLPYPLKYTDQPDAFHYRPWMTAPLMPDYAGDSIWSWHGVFMLHIMKHYRHPKYTEEKARFAAMIERHGTWPEMLSADGSWYYAPIYRGDPGMVWVALFLTL